MRVALAVDHAGVPLRDVVADALLADGHELEDVGEHDDYPDVALAIGRSIAVGCGGARRADLRLGRRRLGCGIEASGHTRRDMPRPLLGGAVRQPR